MEKDNYLKDYTEQNELVEFTIKFSILFICYFLTFILAFYLYKKILIFIDKNRKFSVRNSEMSGDNCNKIMDFSKSEVGLDK